ncbi:hypothetical protein CY34DRAFT_813539 [Suillus luteus UH-Slu-Lm8-n1]|uniref:Uncharacterized protein n=1 Tax=Suillus luteus UH-Slu-Lm8-n1 TaxID=930992 RepID=A0A0C9ZVX3_9AGAM|nr:hypothetical protein CY34DRAFT_813539 [Suillus luteus UH-Slu-Lm8-n1]
MHTEHSLYEGLRLDRLSECLSLINSPTKLSSDILFIFSSHSITYYDLQSPQAVDLDIETIEGDCCGHGKFVVQIVCVCELPPQD